MSTIFRVDTYTALRVRPSFGTVVVDRLSLDEAGTVVDEDKAFLLLSPTQANDFALALMVAAG